MVAMRLVAFGWVYIAVGTAGLVVLLIQWITSGFGLSKRRLFDGSARLQEWWAVTLFAAVRRLFRIDLEVTGFEAVAPGPVIVMMRHASIIDTLLPNVLVTTGAGIRLRYVLKRELLADPTLDIGGNRLVNHFVDRGSNPRAALRAIAALAEGLGPADGVVIYPEGTRFTQERRRRIVDKAISVGDPMAERIEGLRRVLPPRPGGASVLLASGHDVVIVAHTGLEALATIPDAWSGRIVGSRLRVEAWRYPASSLPANPAGRLEWLFERWEEVDEWLAV